MIEENSEKALLLKEAKEELAKRDRHFGVLLESLDDRWKCVSEGLEALDSKIDRHYVEFRDFRAETNEKFGIVFSEIDEVKGDVKSAKGDLKILEKGQKQLLSDNQDFFEELGNQKEWHFVLERRVAVLELKDKTDDFYER
jgi:hypothetical protein